MIQLAESPALTSDGSVVECSYRGVEVNTPCVVCKCFFIVPSSESLQISHGYHATTGCTYMYLISLLPFFVSLQLLLSIGQTSLCKATPTHTVQMPRPHTHLSLRAD